MNKFQSLQNFVFKKIKSEINNKADLRKHIRKSEIKSNRDLLNKYKEYKIIKTVNKAFENSDFYQTKYKSKIKDIEEFHELPLLEPKEIQENHFKMLTTSRKKIFRGFTDRSKRILFKKNELENIIEAISAGLKMAGMEQGDVLQILFPEELPAEKQIRKIKKQNPSILIGANPYIKRLTKTLKKLDIKIDLNLKSIILSRGCVFFPFNEKIRSNIEKKWRCNVYDHYGTTETGFAVSMECKEQEGLHINEKDYFIEIIDPETGEKKQKGEGEIVVTALNRNGMPLIRYRSNDISSIIREKHGCGSILHRLDGIKGEVEKTSWSEIGFFGL